MSEPVFHYPAAVNALKAEKRAEIQRAVKLGLINADQGMKMYFDFMVELAGTRVSLDNPDGNIVLKCTDCDQTHVIPRSVGTYRCDCSPGKDRPTFIGRID